MKAQDLEFYYCTRCKIVLAYEKDSEYDPQCPVCHSRVHLRHLERKCARPVGHITDLIRELHKWAQIRERNYRLNSEPLRTAISYLEEYRELLARERR